MPDTRLEAMNFMQQRGVPMSAANYNAVVNYLAQNPSMNPTAQGLDAGRVGGTDELDQYPISMDEIMAASRGIDEPIDFVGQGTPTPGPSQVPVTTSPLPQAPGGQATPIPKPQVPQTANPQFTDAELSQFQGPADGTVMVPSTNQAPWNEDSFGMTGTSEPRERGRPGSNAMESVMLPPTSPNGEYGGPNLDADALASADREGGLGSVLAKLGVAGAGGAATVYGLNKLEKAVQSANSTNGTSSTNRAVGGSAAIPGTTAANRATVGTRAPDITPAPQAAPRPRPQAGTAAASNPPGKGSGVGADTQRYSQAKQEGIASKLNEANTRRREANANRSAPPAAVQAPNAGYEGGTGVAGKRTPAPKGGVPELPPIPPNANRDETLVWLQNLIRALAKTK